MTRTMRIGSAALAAMIACGTAVAQMKDVPHPFILWTKEEAAAIKKRIDTDPMAAKQLARMEQLFYRGNPTMGKSASPNPTLMNLFKVAVLGDEKLAEAEKKSLLGFIGKVPEPLTAEFKADIQKRLDAVGGDWDKIWTRGMASFADRHMRDEQTLNALRYDVLYDRLTPQEREGVEKAMRTYIQFHLDGHKPWHADFKYGRMTWLPNMSWPRAIGTHVLAVALKDEKLIEGMFNAQGGFKWFIESYLCDGRFYCEEFGKYYSNIGTMLTYCNALDKLGLGKYGWDFEGKPSPLSGIPGGGSMKNFLEMNIWLAYPRTEMPGGMPNWRRVTMGDARGPDGLTEQSMIAGYWPDGKGGDNWFSTANMNGPVPKFQAPLWFEAGQYKYPRAGFDYFLAQMRAPGEEVYLPSLVYGLGPIDPKKVKPPTAAPSYLAYERGFAMLRADETAAYWEGPAPAVAVQFGFYYAHYAHDCFSLLGYQAFNRPIYMNVTGGKVDHYVNEHIRSGPPSGYIARHPWVDTVRGHCGVVVDYLQARPVETGEEGLKNHRMRKHLEGPAKFVAGMTKGVYPDVEQERAVVLTKEYMLDAFWLRSPRKRIYDWNVHGAGSHVLDDRYKPTKELNDSMLYREPGAKQADANADKIGGNDLRDVHRMLPGDKTWTNTVLQDCLVTDPAAKARLTREWYGRKIGVRVTMLGEDGTVVFAGRPPSASSEWGGATLLVRRETDKTAFVAVHEPFQKGEWKLETVERIAQNDGAVAVKVAGKASTISGVAPNDRVLVAYGDGAGKELTLGNNAESFTFTDFAFVRVDGDKVEVTGNLKALKVAVTGSPKLVVNGKEAKAAVAGGVMVYKAE